VKRGVLVGDPDLIELLFHAEYFSLGRLQYGVVATDFRPGATNSTLLRVLPSILLAAS
jgi:hypothetical protein